MPPTKELKIMVRLQDFATKKLKRLGAELKQLNRAGSRFLPFAGGVAGFLAVRKAVTAITEFEDAMAALRGVAISTSDSIKDQGIQFDILEDKARQLGATTRYTAAQSANALLFLARAGFSTSEALDAVDATLDLATAGMLDLGRAADIASNVVTQFRLDANETVRVVNTLVNTANSANTNVEQLAEALIKAGPPAAALKVSVEGTAAAIGVLGDSGIQAGMAGVNLRQVFLKLLNPTAEAERTLNSMGLSLDDVSIEARGLVPVLRSLRTAQLDLSKAAKIFDTRNAAAALTLALYVDRVEELTLANERAIKAASDFSDVINDTVTGSLKNLNSAIDEFTLASAEGFSLNNFFQTILDGLAIITRALAGVPRTLHQVQAAWITFKEIIITGLEFMRFGFAVWADVLVVLWKSAMAKLVSLWADFMNAILDATNIIPAGWIETLDKVREDLGTFVNGMKRSFNDFKNLEDRMVEARAKHAKNLKEINDDIVAQHKKNDAALEGFQLDEIHRAEQLVEISKNKEAKKALEDLRITGETIFQAFKQGSLFRGTFTQSLQEVNEELVDWAANNQNIINSNYELMAQVQQEQSFLLGLQAGFDDLAVASREWGIAARNAVNDVADSLASNLSNGLTDMVTGAKSAKEAFKDMASSIVKDITRIIIQMLILKAIETTLGGLFGSGRGDGSGTVPGLKNQFGDLKLDAQAFGPERGVFTKGGFQHGGIVGPGFGGIGIAGEGSRPELITPITPALARGLSGRSSVTSATGSTMVEQHNSFTISAPPGTSREALQEMVVASVIDANNRSFQAREALR